MKQLKQRCQNFVKSDGTLGGLVSPLCCSPACAESERTKESQPCFILKRRRRPGAFVLRWRGHGRPWGWQKKKRFMAKQTKLCSRKTLCCSILAWRRIFSQIPKASAWDLRRFVLRCLWIYFPNTVEFFAFLKTADPSADTNCCLSYPHWPKSVRIIVFLCKQRIEVNNRSAFTVPTPASPLSFFSSSFLFD